MTKIAGLTYVNEFSFSKEQGFTGSAGVHSVKGYQRGGRVKKDPTVAAGQKHRAPGPGAARGGSIHDRLKAEGGKMGYSYGGAVKNTSSEFVAKKGPMASMDSGTDPGVPTNQMEKETGGRKRTKPKFMAGGKVHRVRKAAPKSAKGARKASKRGMPKNVKAQGGLARARYMGGGHC